MFVYQRVDQVESSCDVYPYCRDVLDYTGTKGAPVNTPDNLHIFILCTCIYYKHVVLHEDVVHVVLVTWRCSTRSSMVHLHEVT